MVSPNQAHDLLVADNPAPTTPVERPTAAEFLQGQTTSVIHLDQSDRTAAWAGRGPLVAAAAFAAVLLLGALIVVLSAGRDDVVDRIPTPTTLLVPDLDASQLQTQAEQLAAAYSSGDFEAVTGLLAEGTQYGWSRTSDFVSGPVLWTSEELRARLEIDAALNTTITLTGCQDLDSRRVSCAVLRVDDLMRAKGLEPINDVRWRFAIDDGLVVEWTEVTPDLSRYFTEAREPFHRWLDDNHPELETPYSDLRGQPWRTDTDFVEAAADLVAEYAASLGVELDG